METCPTCDEEFKNTHGMRIHHVQAHGESIAGEEVTCEQCGDTFTVQRDKAEQRRFCSRECEGDWRSEEFVGEDHYRYNRVTVECDWCGTEIERPPSVVDQYEHDFCDADCRVSWVAENNSGEDHYDYSQAIVKCVVCGDTLKRPKNHRERNEQHFCSRDCYNEALSEQVTGEDNFNWRGGYKSYYGPNWLEQRESALERDDYTCQDCGLTQDEQLAEYGKSLEVHHKTPFRTFEDSANANKLSNLITLCTSCHRQHEARIEA